MKAFARWLYMQTHFAELVKVANVVRQPFNEDGNFFERAKQLGEINGANNALRTLDLLDR